jgi:DNA (cytosine-5)-methyltransferase 1
MEDSRKYKVFDLFAGAGGFSLGFEMGKFDVKLCLERDLWACDTLKANHKKSKIVHADIRSFDTEESVRDICGNSPDVLIGGPPCQGFSNANNNRDLNDPRNSLFRNFAFWIKVLKPKVFIMENVTGILNRLNDKGEKVIDIIKATFEECGYKVDIWKLNAANFGVPQSRERVFIVGNLYRITIPSPTPTHTKEGILAGTKPFVTVGEAILDLPILHAKEGGEVLAYNIDATTHYQTWARLGSRIVANHQAMHHTSRSVERFRLIQNGDLMVNLPDNLKVRKRNGEGELSKSHFHSNYRHLKSDMISFTIPASFYSNFIHPIQPRNITTREAARIQSFPDHYIFKGKRTLISSKLMNKLGKDEDHLSQYNQVGNAVPPLLAKAIADHIRNFLDSHHTPDKVLEIDQEFQQIAI